jgi:methionyl-tRNA formyltransferase
MRHAFVGAVWSSIVALDALQAAGLPPDLVIALPERSRARHSDWRDVGATARGHGLPVYETASINAPETLDRLEQVDPDVIWVMGWSQICRQVFLELPSVGCVGFHPSPLPRNRGRGVIPWTILQRAETTASTLFWLDSGVDSGDILMQEVFPVSPDENAGSLYEKHLSHLAAMVPRAASALSRGQVPRQPQDHSEATWCARRTDQDGRIDWSRSAEEIRTLVRAVSHPYPCAHARWRNEEVRFASAEPVAPGRYWGRPGQIQWIGDGSVIVSCGAAGESLRLNVLDVQEFKLHDNLE